jgi:hypothetical protein
MDRGIASMALHHHNLRPVAQQEEGEAEAAPNYGDFSVRDRRSLFTYLAVVP